MLAAGEDEPMAEHTEQEEGEEMTEKEAAEAAEVEAKMAEALALNQQLRSMVLELEQQEQRSAPLHQPGRIRPARGSSLKTASSLKAASGTHQGQGGWGGKTHTARRANEIDHANAILVAKLSTIATRGADPRRTSLMGEPVHSLPGRSSSTINRSRKEGEIARENAKMARRLATVRPTAALSGKQAANHAANHQRYSRNVSRLPGGPPPSASRQRPCAMPAALVPLAPPQLQRRAPSACRASNSLAAGAGKRGRNMAQVSITAAERGWQS
mmetsp:Transcript_33905/g.76769  ORF Transcript_33905/g.76769 Transcript_33905/m.76769 type:complete len:271 (-) Transcript_33905:308-1120(-)